MIGIINDNEIFEFRELIDLAEALQNYANTKNMNGLYIIDSNNNVKASIENDQFVLVPKQLNENELYQLVMSNSINDNIDYNDTYLYENKSDVSKFRYLVCKYPTKIMKELD